MENREEALIEAYHRFKREAETVQDKDWEAFNARAMKFIELLHKAGMESYKQTALTYWDAAGRRTWNEREQSLAAGTGGSLEQSTSSS